MIVLAASVAAFAWLGWIMYGPAGMVVGGMLASIVAIQALRRSDQE